MEKSGTQQRIFNSAVNWILHAFGDISADRAIEVNQASEIWVLRPLFT